MGFLRKIRLLRCALKVLVRQSLRCHPNFKTPAGIGDYYLISSTGPLWRRWGTLRRYPLATEQVLSRGI